MAFILAQALGWASIVLGAIVYLGAVAGVFFVDATPPLDVGAVSWLGTGLIFGILGLAVHRQPAL